MTRKKADKASNKPAKKNTEVKANIDVRTEVKNLRVDWSYEEMKDHISEMSLNLSAVKKFDDEIAQLKESRKEAQTFADTARSNMIKGKFDEVDVAVTFDFDKKMIYSKRLDTGEELPIMVMQAEDYQTNSGVSTIPPKEESTDKETMPDDTEDDLPPGFNDGDVETV